MFKINKLQDQPIKERNQRQQLEDQLARQTANLDYVAMMAEVDIPAAEDANETTEIGGEGDVTKV